MPSDRTIDMLRALVGFDTVSRNSNLALIEHVDDYLKGLGLETRRVYGAEGDKANIVATVGPKGVPGYILSGHTDVVPVDDQDWTTDPFSLRIDDGKAYGRGTTDMKGFVACVLGKVPAMIEANPKIPLHLCFSYDEEVGCQGVRELIGELRQWPFTPRGCFVGEPTSMDVVIAHKAKQSYRTEVRGTFAHSSTAPTAVNAVEYAADIVVKIRDIGRRLAKDGPRDALFDVPFTTAHTGQMHGGTALNIVPDHCWFDWEFRAIPEDDLDGLVAEVKRHAEEVLLPQMRAVAKEADITFRQMAELPAVKITAEDELTLFTKHLAGRNGHRKVAYGTEGGIFQRDGGVPSIVCGPGSIDQAHKPDEFVTLDQLERCEAFLDRLIDHCRTS
jgi:acetylornithine deacetylase